MNPMEEAEREKANVSSCHLAPIFADIMRQGQIAFADWHELMTAPWDSSFNSCDEDIITRLIYGVHRGLVKVVEEP
ncbi:MAG TPA: hypothetical protein DDZ80_16500 [Cyanobacteria bacterium UBA8803]|nr:hypothetical protein [Cyanobacteria bacterium UBA9273]HBL60010.1 hypothetical protein [Cyanobacteria bacterium UBA8803]